jgi:hypothetical protein
MTQINVDPFLLSEMEERERKQFNSSVGRLKKKLHSVENIMYSQPFADTKEDFKDAWSGKLNIILSDDCGLTELAATRNPRPVLGRQDTADDTCDSRRVQTPIKPKTPKTAEGEKKKKKKKLVLKENDLALRKPFGGCKKESETIRVINNYRGANTIYRDRRVLKRLGPQGQGPLSGSAVPPWIGPMSYPNKTADAFFYGHPTIRHQTAFKSMGREPKPLDEIKQELSTKKDWSGLFSGENSVYGNSSQPFSAKSSRTNHEKCVEHTEDSNVWSKMSYSTTMGAKQVVNHIQNAQTPIFGHKTKNRQRSPKKRRPGKLDGEESVDSLDSGDASKSQSSIAGSRIFDHGVLNEMLLEEQAYDVSAEDDDDSLASSVFGSISTTSLSTQKRYDAISLLSKSVNFSVYSGFSVDKVVKQMVVQRKMKRELSDYTMGVLDSCKDSEPEVLEFTDPKRGNATGYNTQCNSLSHTPYLLTPRQEEAQHQRHEAQYEQQHQQQHLNHQQEYQSQPDPPGSPVEAKALSDSLAALPGATFLPDSSGGGDKKPSSAGSGNKPKGILKRRDSIIKRNPGLLSLTPQSTDDSITHKSPPKVTRAQIEAAPGRRATGRRGNITLIPLGGGGGGGGGSVGEAKTLNDASLDSYQLQEDSQFSVHTAPQTQTKSYSNFMSELTRSKSTVIDRSISMSRPGSGAGGAPGDPPRLVRGKSVTRSPSRSLSRSMSKFGKAATSFEEKSNAEDVGLVTLGGLLLPGEGIDEDGTAALYSPPASPRAKEEAARVDRVNNPVLDVEEEEDEWWAPDNDSNSNS